MSKICLTLAERSLADLQRKLETYINRVPMIEIRLDYLDPVRIPEIKSGKTEIIATCRPQREGGFFNGSEQERLQVLSSAAEAGCQWIDLEHDVKEPVPIESEIRVIRSVHRFDDLSEEWVEDLHLLLKLQGDLAKLAVTPRNLNDLQRLMEWMEQDCGQHPRVILGMGDTGWPTRILTDPLGNAWTYVVESETDTVAPGQFSWETARDTFRLDRETDNTTRFVCIVGQFRWIWELSLWINRILVFENLPQICIPVFGEAGRSWFDYIRSSKLAFSGLASFCSSDPAGGNIDILLKGDDHWHQSKIHSAGSFHLNTMPDRNILIDMIKVLFNQELGPIHFQL